MKNVQNSGKSVNDIFNTARKAEHAPPPKKKVFLR